MSDNSTNEFFEVLVHIAEGLGAIAAAAVTFLWQGIATSKRETEKRLADLRGELKEQIERDRLAAAARELQISEQIKDLWAELSKQGHDDQVAKQAMMDRIIEISTKLGAMPTRDEMREDRRDMENRITTAIRSIPTTDGDNVNGRR